MRPDAFSTHHPAVTLTFFVGVIVLCVLVQQPVVQAVGLMGAVLYYLCLRGRDAWRLLVAMALALVMLAAINPLFNTLGDTVLFTYLGTRPYTLEALAYGASTATMFVSVMLWFACYAQVMSTDKFTYLFGRRRASAHTRADDDAAPRAELRTQGPADFDGAALRRPVDDAGQRARACAGWGLAALGAHELGARGCRDHGRLDALARVRDERRRRFLDSGASRLRSK